MSLSEAPSIQITYNTAQDVSDEILGGTIQFCREAGYKQTIAKLTFFWAALLLSTADFLTNNQKNTRSLYMDIIFNNGETNGLDSEYGIMKEMPEGTAVNVMILHVPSNKAIFDKVVYVE